MLGSPLHAALIVSAVTYMLADPQQALAWGPGIHIALGSEILNQAALLPAAIAGVITRYSLDYLYGNIAADLVFAKKLSRIKQFCHHWSTGFATLDRADDDRGRAFAYGYLSHLAADTVAHNQFVPHQIAASGVTLNFGHVYWEIRADHTVSPELWTRVDQVIGGDHQQHHHTLEALLTDTFLPFSANRHLFAGINDLVLCRSWRRTVSSLDRYSRHHLSEKLLEEYLEQSRSKIFDLLSHLQDSAVLLEDPNGTAALNYIRLHRRHLRSLHRRGIISSTARLEAAASHAPAIARIQVG